MKILAPIFTHVMKRRIGRIEAFIKEPHLTQQKILKNLLATAKATEFGKQYAFHELTDLNRFKNRVPIHTYEQLFPYIQRTMRGEQNILWPARIVWFAKSSGTTNARSKFIPVSPESLHDCHFRGGKDLASLYVHAVPNTKIFSGKGIAVGGSCQINELNKSYASYYGDVSAVIMKNLPKWAQYIRSPNLDIALMSNWEEKIELLASQVLHQNITSMLGVPTWVALILQRVLEKGNKKHITEIWPNFEVFFYGAVAFAPYKNLFTSFFPENRVLYWNTYNASEGAFAFQDRQHSEDLLLMLDYGVFYEFLPLSEVSHENPNTLSLDQVELDKDYVMIISTNAGLWRYNLGDTVRFTSLSPYRVRISGRTKHFINVFGEEVVVENAETAIAQACEKTGAIIANFTVGPVFLEKARRGKHEWIIEFKEKPPCLDEFTRLLDQSLRQINSDYDAKRSFDLALNLPIVQSVQQGTFYNWMKKRNKLGGQHKVPRLSNSRRYVDDILSMAE